MHVDKAKKRIAKLINKGFGGYPHIELAYFGATANCATEVVVSFVLTKGDAPQQQRFVSKQDVREDEAIQSVLIKIIERANANTVSEVAGVTVVA
ncbi:hypothetical protein [Rheinheimera maricola]|uniref:Uncharacterized protein n=1 Tax=Rheinheimera maricola TaxID=2793282 RepID=A0ABS7XDA6_9GAMM|nr:hypothetical protein [Rheinheimera maricola]MBZ9613540.1 hypothetical protein [Rheinheimera maricola]